MDECKLGSESLASPRKMSGNNNQLQLRSKIKKHGEGIEVRRHPKKTLSMKPNLNKHRRKPVFISSDKLVDPVQKLLGKRIRSISKRSERKFHSSVPKSFECHLPACGKTFNDRASLKKHMTVHGDKLFQCTFDGCEKRFLDNAKLKRHMLVHTGEKPY